MIKCTKLLEATKMQPAELSALVRLWRIAKNRRWAMYVMPITEEEKRDEAEVLLSAPFA
jgi:hypothetical protein